MPTINPGRDAEFRFDNTSTWAIARDSSTAQTVRTTATAAIPRASGANSVFDCYRYMAAFDTSGITGTVASATLKLYGYIYTTADLIVVKVSSSATGSPTTNFVAADFGRIDGFVAGSSMAGNVTDYSAEIPTWLVNQYNSITLTSDALSDLSSLSTFRLAVVTYDYDYLNVAPGITTFRSGFRTVNVSNTSQRPVIDYTLSTGYSNSILGVSAANISTVSGVATANIDKVNGV
jgi:hypothetical protein